MTSYVESKTRFLFLVRLGGVDRHGVEEANWSLSSDFLFSVLSSAWLLPCVLAFWRFGVLRLLVALRFVRFGVLRPTAGVQAAFCAFCAFWT